MTPDPLTIAAAAVRLYAESHPRPIHVTKTDAAKMLGISRPTVDTLIKAGTLSDGGQRTVRIGAGFGGSWGIFGEWGITPHPLPAGYPAADSRSAASKTTA